MTSMMNGVITLTLVLVHSPFNDLFTNRLASVPNTCSVLFVSHCTFVKNLHVKLTSLKHVHPVQRVTPLLLQQEEFRHNVSHQPSPNYNRYGVNTTNSDLYSSRSYPNGSYRQSSYHQERSHTPNYPDDNSDYPNLLQNSHNFSQSQEGLIMVNASILLWVWLTEFKLCCIV